MQGLALARKFYDHCRASLEQDLGELMTQACCGLVGEGSECFGLDDELSQDHDFGCAFCLWFKREVLNSHKADIEAAFAKLPLTFMGYNSRLAPNLRQGRVGPISIEGFYLKFLGLERAPQTIEEWLTQKEYQLACCTNGEIFFDHLGEFSKIRDNLLHYYPQELWLTKLAGKCVQMAQAGQYNFPRSLNRNDYITATLAKSKFCEAALAFVALINKRYLPFYKQAAKFVANLPLMGQNLATLLASLCASNAAFDLIDQAQEIEEFCSLCANFLYQNALSQINDSWLWVHGSSIMQQVTSKELRKLDLLHI